MNKTIMIIEDDLETQLLFSQLLESEGYSVITKSSGRDAIDFLKINQLPNLIFMDLDFPNGTPEDFKAELHHICHDKTPPIVVVSGNVDIEEFAERLEAVSYVKKPFEINPILNLITEVI